MNPRLRLTCMLMLAIVLIAAQALGLVHRTLHGPLAGSGVPAQALVQKSPGAESVAFSDHQAGDIQCRLLDSLGHAGPPTVPVVLLPLAMGSFELAHCHGESLARWVALFDARGPPARS